MGDELSTGLIKSLLSRCTVHNIRVVFLASRGLKISISFSNPNDKQFGGLFDGDINQSRQGAVIIPYLPNSFDLPIPPVGVSHLNLNMWFYWAISGGN